MSTATTADPTPTLARTGRDLRGFWRVLLAVVAPLPWLAKAVNYAVVATPGDAPFGDTVRYLSAHRHAYAVLQWFDTAFVVLVVPSVIAVAMVARRGAPLLTTVAAGLAGLGFLFGITRGANDDMLAYLTATKGLDVATVGRLDEAYQANPTAAVGSLLFIVGLVFGTLLLGIALWRSRAVPRWTAVALAVGGFTHPFIPSHYGVAAGLVVAAVGFCGASYALLRMTDDEFDLPPLGR
jgi:hypothetical protein